MLLKRTTKIEMAIERRLIASGKIEHPLQAIADGGRCTWFLTPANPITRASAGSARWSRWAR